MKHALGVPCKEMGSTRCKQPEAWRGLEVNPAFYPTEAEITGARHCSRNADNDSMPDPKIEVDIRHSRIYRSETYSAFARPKSGPSAASPFGSR
jgi:hypothetical protein